MTRRLFKSIYIILVFSILLSYFSALSYGDDQNATALFEEGFRYFEGDGIPQDMPKGISLIHQAADAGSVDAMLMIAHLYNLGLGSVISDDYVDGTGADLSLTWFDKIADAGQTELAGNEVVGLAFDYFLGSEDGSIKEDDAVALKFFQKAAGYGNPTAIGMMATFYTYGFGVEKDPSKALDLLVSLVDRDIPDSESTLEDYAYGYYSGSKPEIDINYGTAFQYYQALADRGNERAMYNLALLYENGLGVAPDHVKAVEWLSQASELGFAPASTLLSQFNSD